MSTYAAVKEYLLHNKFRWLITGVAGFIGSNLLESLLKLNQEVIGLDNFSTGFQKNLDEVLSKLNSQQRLNFRFVFGDVCSLADCNQVTKDVDFVLHQAAIGSVPRSIEDPLTTNNSNVVGFLNIINAAKDNKVKRFVYASSSSVYGDSPTLPKKESHFGSLLSPYAVSKYTNELYADVFAKVYGIEVIGLRYFNVFGPRQDPDGPYAAVIPLWIKEILNGDDVYINGDGTTTRDFCYVANVVQANLLTALTKNDSALRTVYNVATGESTSLQELFNLIVDILRKQGIHPNYRNFREGDIKDSLADISKARTLLNYEPTHKISDGLAEAMPWYIKNT